MLFPTLGGTQLCAVLRAFQLTLESGTYLRAGFRGAVFALEGSTYFGTTLGTEWLALATWVQKKSWHRSVTTVEIRGFNQALLECSLVPQSTPLKSVGLLAQYW